MSTSTCALTSSSSLPSSSSSKKSCYNTGCTDVVSDRPRNGWRLCIGEYAELCDRCACAYEEGKFCEKFHWNASGWRCCQACGKRVHCGCIVSANEFTLLDPGGIQCMMCARKNVILPPTPTWPSSMFFHSPLPDRVKDLPGKNWSQLAGSGPVPWRQAPTLFSNSPPTAELHLVEMKTGVNKINSTEKISVPSLDKRKNEDLSERFMNGSLNDSTREIHEDGITGIKCSDQPSSCTSMTQQSVPMKEESSTTPFGLTVPYASPNESNSQNGISGMHSRIPLPPTQRQFYGILSDQPSEAQIRNGRARGDPRGKNNLLPRYWPRFTDQELHQISVEYPSDPMWFPQYSEKFDDKVLDILGTNSAITPLFEKMLSASDAGRIGRLVLPKKCAEAYFPPISQPEGLPLKVQDAKGKEWIFQFRFWPNNNSRMYVLEGVTPCIQSMQLQAGDIVTFSRLEPEGKLVMGFRKASAAQDQEIETNKNGTGVSTNGDAEKVDPSLWTKVDKSGYIAKEVMGAKSSISRKRKNSTLGSKSKRLKIESGDMIEVKITWEEAQGLLRPPLDHVPSVVVIEGFEFEEYEDAPILGRPTIIPPDNSGEKIQWAQCEDCFKWRKLPVNALLPSRFTCSVNSWEPNRSFCTADQELTKEQIEELLTPGNSVSASKKSKAAKPDPDGIDAIEGLDALANLAILDEGESVQASSSQATTKHPRHRPGCSCIVCIQPPSGKGPKHKQTCTCNVCLTVKRRFKTLMMRREKKQSEKELEPTQKKQQKRQDKSLDDESLLCNSNTTNSSPSQKRGDANDGSDDEPSRMNNNKSSTSSPFKGQIDLNIQPERDEELSPGSDSVPMIKLVKDAEILLRQKRILSSSNGSGSGSGSGENNSKNGTDLENNNQENPEKDFPSMYIVKSAASILGTG